MITEHDLQEAIAECEGQRNPTSSTCLKLAAFYTIRDNLFPTKQENSEPVFYSGSPDPIERAEYVSDTEFGQAIAGMSVDEIMPIMDELMSTIKVVSPRLYDGVMRRIDPMY